MHTDKSIALQQTNQTTTKKKKNSNENSNITACNNESKSDHKFFYSKAGNPT